MYSYTAKSIDTYLSENAVSNGNCIPSYETQVVSSARAELKHKCDTYIGNDVI